MGVILGLLGAGALLGAVAWSIVYPLRRIWPPERVTPVGFTLTWGATGLAFGASIYLGLVGWGTAAVPGFVRALGAVLLVGAHFLLWPEVFRFGVAKTSGAGNGLETGGLYSVLRNPQYAGDILLLLGWSLLCAAPLVWPVAAVTAFALWLAPIAEEPWLEARYPKDYAAYRARTPRWLPRL